MEDETFLRAVAADMSARLPEPQEDELDLIAVLAEDPANGMVELAPGVYTVNRRGWGVSG